jgi:hypothetical protein
LHSFPPITKRVHCFYANRARHDKTKAIIQGNMTIFAFYFYTISM